eukprot:1656271-Pyramimonas_sp.AAC.1
MKLSRVPRSLPQTLESEAPPTAVGQRRLSRQTGSHIQSKGQGASVATWPFQQWGARGAIPSSH